MSMCLSSGVRAFVTVRGTVQGVGFRPWVYRLAMDCGLSGWVRNAGSRVEIVVEGPRAKVDVFLARSQEELPPHAHVFAFAVRTEELPDWTQGTDRGVFCILPSADPATSGNGNASDGDDVNVDLSLALASNEAAGGATKEPPSGCLPDLAVCPECASELFDAGDRRYRYPFINCTQCGPRYTIIYSTPYDRPRTTMREFRMCSGCRGEYEDPGDRRFHAQPIACPGCGPQLSLKDASGRVLATEAEALDAAVLRLGHGGIVALKGLGGFQLLVDATNEEAVLRLRDRKHRPARPFALMFETVSEVEAYCHVSNAEKALMESAEAPIVLLQRKPRSSAVGKSLPRFEVVDAIAPAATEWGVMVPYTPLHLLLLRDFGRPLVVTSGNRSGEPICRDDEEAQQRLQGIADLWLTHDRPIHQLADDSVARIVVGRPQIIRRARGFVPRPVRLPSNLPPTLALGGELKNTVALASGDHAWMSPHLGDLENDATDALHKAQVDAFLATTLGAEPPRLVCDLHPDYASTRRAEDLARKNGLPLRRVQHHAAHLYAVMAEHGIDAPALGFSWDGTGDGGDGTVWGGECLRIGDSGFERMGHLLPFPLPGGDQVAREPRRSALGLLFAMDADLDSSAVAPLRAQFTEEEWSVLTQILQRDLQCPRSSSAGRLFDGVASLLGLGSTTSFEGEAAMKLEWSQEGPGEAYPLPFRPPILDWRPMVQAILEDLQTGVPRGRIAANFHATLVDAIVRVAKFEGETDVMLSGGCFLNRTLLEGAIHGLRRAGFRPWWSESIPINDGGLSLGQIWSTTKEPEHVPSRSR